MADIFLKIFNMSISACWIVLAIILYRAVLKKAPKWVNCVLWGIAGLRLVLPFSFESILSLIPSAEFVPQELIHSNSSVNVSGTEIFNYVGNNPVSYDLGISDGSLVFTEITAPDGNYVNPLLIITFIASIVWVVGIVALLIYTLVSFLRLKKKIGTAVLLKENIYQSENISSPFVLGVIKPKIYLPFYMNERDIPPVVAHEKAHIQRRDYLWKPLGFLILSIHWFNPLVWLGYLLLCRDIELACDEKVVKTLSNEQRADYSEALLTCSVNRRMIAACPLAFGEVGVKNRVKSVLNYKKPAFWVIVIALILCVALAIGFLTNPVNLYVYNSRYETGKCLYSYVVSADKETENNELVFDITSDGKVYKTYGDGTTDELGILKESDYTAEKLKEALKNQDMKLSIGNIKNAYELSDYIFLQKSNGTVYLVSLFSDGKIMSVFKLIRTGESDIQKSKDNAISGAFKAVELVYDDGMYSFVQTVDSLPLFIIENDMQLFEKSDIYTSGPLGTFKEISLNEDNFDLRFRSYNDYSWQTDDTLQSIKKNNKRAWEFYSTQSADVDTVHILLEQKDGSFYFGYGYYNAGTINPVNSDDSHIRWLYKIERTEDENTSTDISVLRNKYPHFFDVSTDGGLTVYVWQMSEENYRCYLANTSMEAISDNSFIYATDESASVDEMKAILSDYAIAPKELTVQGIRNPLSSYYYELDEAYQKKVKALFSDIGLQTEFEVTVSYANSTEVSELYAGALNSNKMYQSSIQHLPIYRFDTLNDLEQFKKAYGNLLTMDSGYDEIPSFNDATSKYDNAFFEENSLVLVYVTAGSGSFRFGVQSVGYDEKSFMVHIQQLNNPEVYTMDMAGWFITLAVPDSLIENCSEFDADLDNIIELYDGKSIPKLTVQCGAVETDAVTGTLTWTSEAGNGKMQTINADSSLPLAQLDSLLSTALNIPQTDSPLKAQLDFDITPNKITVNSWYIDENGKNEEFEAETDGSIIILNNDNRTCVYEIIAEWNSSKKYYGTVRYSFCVMGE